MVIGPHSLIAGFQNYDGLTFWVVIDPTFCTRFQPVDINVFLSAGYRAASSAAGLFSGNGQTARIRPPAVRSVIINCDCIAANAGIDGLVGANQPDWC